jgi:predicted nuclease of predicted toxin-antitoxin system
MNLSPEWVNLLAAEGWSAIHWSKAGNPKAEDWEIMSWARNDRRIVFTNDLDFTIALALTEAEGPSLVQVRGPNVLPELIGSRVIASIHLHTDLLSSGAILTIDPDRARVRILPIR